MAKIKSGGSRAEVVTESIGADILAGRLEPGRRLTFPELCPVYAVSVGVLREALIRLVDRGLVRTESHQGFSVIPLSPSDLEGLTQVRMGIEPAFVYESVLQGSVQWESEVIAAHHRLERTPIYSGGDESRLSDEWVAVHAEFHEALISGCDNRRMHEISARLRREADLYRRWSLAPEDINQQAAANLAEHRALMEAAVSRDASLTERLLREHIKNAADTMLKSSIGVPAEGRARRTAV